MHQIHAFHFQICTIVSCNSAGLSDLSDAEWPSVETINISTWNIPPYLCISWSCPATLTGLCLRVCQELHFSQRPQKSELPAPQGSSCLHVRRWNEWRENTGRPGGRMCDSKVCYLRAQARQEIINLNQKYSKWPSKEWKHPPSFPRNFFFQQKSSKSSHCRFDFVLWKTINLLSKRYFVDLLIISARVSFVPNTHRHHKHDLTLGILSIYLEHFHLCVNQWSARPHWAQSRKLKAWNVSGVSLWGSVGGMRHIYYAAGVTGQVRREIWQREDKQSWNVRH